MLQPDARFGSILLQKLNDFPAYCQISLFNEKTLPILAKRTGLQYRLRLTRLVLVEPRPVARQIAARGRLCAGAGWPGVSCSPALPARSTAFLIASTLTPPACPCVVAVMDARRGRLMLAGTLPAAVSNGSR